MKRAAVVGCGLAGAVTARFLAEQMGCKVTVYEKRGHIGGNMFDYVNEAGILVHRYGPHTFHTKKKELYDYMCRYGEWQEFRLTCGAVINGIYTPTPFNFRTVEDFFPAEKADAIKRAIKEAYPHQNTAPVLELLKHRNPLIREYAEFLFDNDYSLYTAKQWGISPKEIDPSVLERVPVRFDHREGYFEDPYQVMPKISYTEFFEKLLDHENIEVHLKTDALPLLELDERAGVIRLAGEKWEGPVIFTGAIDELFGSRYGSLPYRSLRFEWRTEAVKSFQPAPVVAYPQAEGYTRITEYTKLPVQEVGEKTSYAIEYSLPYREGVAAEPYYPIPNGDNYALYEKYRALAERFENLYLCGRLAEYRYYNMDQALERALRLCDELGKLSV